MEKEVKNTIDNDRALERKVKRKNIAKTVVNVLIVLVILLEFARAIYGYCTGDWREALHATNMFIWIGLAFWYMRDSDKTRQAYNALFEVFEELSHEAAQLVIENIDLKRRLKNPEYNKIWERVEDDEAFAKSYNAMFSTDIPINYDWDLKPIEFKYDQLTDADSDLDSGAETDSDKNML